MNQTQLLCRFALEADPTASSLPAGTRCSTGARQRTYCRSVPSEGSRWWPAASSTAVSSQAAARTTTSLRRPLCSSESRSSGRSAPRTRSARSGGAAVPVRHPAVEHVLVGAARRRKSRRTCGSPSSNCRLSFGANSRDYRRHTGTSGTPRSRSTRRHPRVSDRESGKSPRSVAFCAAPRRRSRGIDTPVSGRRDAVALPERERDRLAFTDRSIRGERATTVNRPPGVSPVEALARHLRARVSSPAQARPEPHVYEHVRAKASRRSTTREHPRVGVCRPRVAVARDAPGDNRSISVVR